MQDHSGHRERLRKRFRAEGLDHFEEKQALELLLYYVIPRRDTEPIARELISYFGSLEGVLTAPIDNLAQIPGMGEKAATYLKIISDFTRFRMAHNNNSAKTLNSVQQCADYLKPQFLWRRDEMCSILCLDAQCHVLGSKIISEGSVNSTEVPLRKIMGYAISVNATTIILAHNHPGGFPLPSADDQAVTHHIAESLNTINILLADHLIFSNNEYVSMVESGLYTPLR